MASKEFESILKQVPAATVTKEESSPTSEKVIKKKTEMARIVAVVPQDLKDQIQEYVKKEKGMSESALVIKALKALGFRVSSEFEIDRRTTR
jgi:hypothetical protein